MTSSFPMWLVALFALQAAGTLDVSDTSRGYAREATVGDGAAVDVENTPRLAVALDWPTTSLAFEYAPRFFWSDIGAPDASPTLLLHSAGLRLSARDERLRVSLMQTFAVGDQSFARIGTELGPLSPGPGATPVPSGGVTPAPQIDLLPDATVLRVLAIESSASVRYDWSRRVSTELRPSFGISGGADTAAQRALPRQRTARVDASLDYRASRRDVLTTGLGLAHSSISNGYEHRLISLMETWSRSFAPETGVGLGAGVALQETRGPIDSRATQWRPVGVARAWHTLVARAFQVHLHSELGHQPHINVLTGALQGQLYASANATLASGDTSVGLTLGAAQTLPPDEPDAAQSLTADLVLEQALLDWLSAELGAQLAWQSLGGGSALAAGDARWLLFAGATVALPGVRF